MLRPWPEWGRVATAGRRGVWESSVSSWVAMPEPRLLYEVGERVVGRLQQAKPGPSSKGLRVCLQVVRGGMRVQHMTWRGRPALSIVPGALEHVLWVLGTVTGTSCLSSSQTVLRIVVLGIWDYIENKIGVKTNAHP